MKFLTKDHQFNRVLNAPMSLICLNCGGWGDLIRQSKGLSEFAKPIKLGINLCEECYGTGIDPIPLTEIL